LIIKRLVKFCLLITLFNCASLISNAYHLIGGELTYECTNEAAGIYLVKLSLYRDCNCEKNYDCSDFDDIAYITIFNGLDGFIRTEELHFKATKQIKPNIEGLCLETVPDLCIESSIGYEKEITLKPSIFGYKIVYQRCRRNSTIVNIEQPGMAGSTYQVTIPSNDVATCNSSPVFKNYPPIVICAGFPLEFDNSATDNDGDSLVYELCSPLIIPEDSHPKPEKASSPPYESVNWVGGFSQQNQIGADPKFTVNSSTGLLKGTPLRAGQYVVGICVKEYNSNNELISTMARDFQFNVADCGIVKAKIKADQIKEDGTYVVQQCEDYNVDFLNESIGATNFTWDFDDPNNSYDYSNDRNASYEYSDTGKYLVQLIADPNETCKDTAYIELNMYPTNEPDFIWTGGCTDEPVQFFIDTSKTDFSTIINWQWVFSDIDTIFNQEGPVLNFYDRTSFDVELTVTTHLGCIISTTKAIDLDIIPVAKFEHSKLCSNQQPVQFTDVSTIGSGIITTRKWIVYDEHSNELYTANTKLMQYTFEPGNYSVNLEVTGNNGCNNTIDMPITVLDKLEIDAGAELDICENTTFEINNEMHTSYNELNVPVIQPPQSDAYVITAFDLNGCSATDTLNVNLYKAPQLNIGTDTVICFKDQVFLQPKVESFYNGNLNYQWQNNPFLDDLTQFNQYISPDSSSLFHLKVTESTYGCSTSDSIFVQVDRPVIPNVSNDTIVCPGSTIKLFASGGDTYGWYNNQQIMGENPELEVQVNNNSEYTINISNSCFFAENIVIAEVYDMPTIDAGEDIEIEVGKSYTLEAPIL